MENQTITDMIAKYTEWAMIVQAELRKDTSWVEQYKAYAESMLDDTNREKYLEAKKKFHIWHPLHAYITIGEIDKQHQNASFDLRYLGQSVGTVKVCGEDVTLTVAESQDKNSNAYFGYCAGTFKDKEWKNSREAKAFRAYYRGNKDLTETKKSGKPHSEEHMVESALFSELEKKSSKDKTLKDIQPVSYAGVRIHMKTAVKASLSGKKDTVSGSQTGGEIDCLCRRNVKPGVSRLVAIEIKDENKESESFDNAVKQAISYAVFLRELTWSEAGEYWKTIWGMENQYKNNVCIDAVVAMPKGKTKPSYNGERISFDNGDFIELHYIEITSKISPDNSEDVKFCSSYFE